MVFAEFVMTRLFDVSKETILVMMGRRVTTLSCRILVSPLRLLQSLLRYDNLSLQCCRSLAMKVFVCLGFVLAAGVANAQTYTTTVNRTTNSTSTTGGGFTAATQTSRTTNTVTYTTTVRRTGGYQPM